MEVITIIMVAQVQKTLMKALPPITKNHPRLPVIHQQSVKRVATFFSGSRVSNDLKANLILAVGH